MLAGRREPGSGAVRPGSSAAAAGAAAATACGRPRGARRRWRRNQHDRGRLWGGGEIRKTPVNPDASESARSGQAVGKLRGRYRCCLDAGRYLADQEKSCYFGFDCNRAEDYEENVETRSRKR